MLETGINQACHYPQTCRFSAPARPSGGWPCILQIRRGTPSTFGTRQSNTLVLHSHQPVAGLVPTSRVASYLFVLQWTHWTFDFALWWMALPLFQSFRWEEDRQALCHSSLWAAPRGGECRSRAATRFATTEGYVERVVRQHRVEHLNVDSKRTEIPRPGEGHWDKPDWPLGIRQHGDERERDTWTE